MSQLLLRYIDSQTITFLKNRAKLHHRSLQGEIKSIFEDVVNAPRLSIASWPAGFLERIIGGWQGDAPIRPFQGDYESRDELE